MNALVAALLVEFDDLAALAVPVLFRVPFETTRLA